MKKEIESHRDSGLFQKKLIDQVANDLVQTILEANPESLEGSKSLNNIEAALKEDIMDSENAPSKTHTSLKKRAEEIYRKRISTGKPGDALSDWLQAEKDIKKEQGVI
jgi:hypothetical protein